MDLPPGAQRIVIHIESTPDPLSLVRKIRQEYQYKSESSYGVDIGVALNIDTPNEEVYDILNALKEDGAPIDFVQFMGIRKYWLSRLSRLTKEFLKNP